MNGLTAATLNPSLRSAAVRSTRIAASSSSPAILTKIAETSFCMSGVPPTPGTLYFRVSRANSRLPGSSSGSPLNARQRFTASSKGFSCPAMA